MRRVVFDLETTGLSARQGDRIIEIGAVEILDRQVTGNEFHRLVNPECDIDAEASKIHGYTRKDLEDSPLFAEVAEQLLQFIAGSQLIIHNAEFDTGFLNAELDRLTKKMGTDLRDSHSAWTVLDTLTMARERHPGQRNNLDALIDRYGISGPDRDVHGALKDARLLASVYLAMSSGQTRMDLDGQQPDQDQTGPVSAPADYPPTPRMPISEAEIEADRLRMQQITGRATAEEEGAAN